MAVAYTVDTNGVQYLGNMKAVSGTFTSANGDGNAQALAPSVHGLNYIVDYHITLDTGGVNVPTPKVTINGGTLTWTVDDTLGYSGKFYVLGR